jgi:hypothetical protein
MQHLNNDMDDLFRKAAENYPLRTGVPDWDKVAAGLKEDEDKRPVILPFYRRYLLLISLGLLLLTGAGIYPLFYRSVARADNEVTTAQTPSDTSSLRQNTPVTAEQSNSDIMLPLDRNAEDRPATAGNGNDNEVVTGSVSENSVPNESALNGRSRSSESGSTDNGGNRLLSRHQLPVDESLSGLSAVAPAENTAISTIAPIPVITGLNEPEPYITIPGIHKVEAGAVIVPPVEGRQLAAGPVIIKKLSTAKRVYAGLAGGIDFTSVSLQRIGKPGFHYGATAGYRISNRFSIEAGFFIEKKDYYTSAKHFDKSRLYVNPNSTILSIDGVCYMYEIPLSIKYDISNTYRSVWFVTGGLSSYIMRKEDYSMLYRYTSSNTTAKHDYTYRNSGSALFSQLRITGGYIYKLPAGFSLRLEPYLNVPVREAGYGKLRLVSGGMNAGIFKQLF